MWDDQMALASALAIWGQGADVIPMAPSPAGPNAPAQPDQARGIAPVRAIRSEYSARLDVSNNGMGRASGIFRQGAAGQVHIITFAAAALPYEARAGDHIRWADRPDHLYRIAEAKPDGAAGVHFILNRV